MTDWRRCAICRSTWTIAVGPDCPYTDDHEAVLRNLRERGIRR